MSAQNSAMFSLLQLEYGHDLGFGDCVEPVFLLHNLDALWLTSYPLGYIDRLQAWSPRVPEAGMNQKDLNLPSIASLGAFSDQFLSFSHAAMLRVFTTFSKLNPQLWRRHFRHLAFLLHLPILLLVCDFWGTGPRDAILHVYSALCLSLSCMEHLLQTSWQSCMLRHRKKVNGLYNIRN